MSFSIVKSDFVPLVHNFNSLPDVVDLASYRPDSEAVRSLRVVGVSGDGSTPVYDFTDGVDDGSVSDMVVTLRSGQLDKADVDTIQRSLISEGQSNAEKAHSEAVSNAVDSLLGVSSSEK